MVTQPWITDTFDDLNLIMMHSKLMFWRPALIIPLPNKSRKSGKGKTKSDANRYKEDER